MNTLSMSTWKKHIPLTVNVPLKQTGLYKYHVQICVFQQKILL